jgi:hypothetical protein
VTAAGDIEGDGRDDVLIGTGRWGHGRAFIYAHASAVGAVSGVVLGDGAPLPGLTIDAYGATGESWRWTSTAADGTYEFADLPIGQHTVTLVLPLGYRAVSPLGSAQLSVCSGQSATLDFVLEQVVACDVRSCGYWKHQVNVYWNDRGHAQESHSAMTYSYPYLIKSHFYDNGSSPIRVEGVTHRMQIGADPLDLGSMVNTLNGHNTAGQVGEGNKWAQAAQQFLAVLLNVVSNRLSQGEVVSDDGATASQAIQDVAAMLVDENETNDGLAKDIAEAMNQGRMLPAALVDLSRPTIYYAQPMPLTPPAADPVSVAPNPMVRTSTIGFETTAAGRAEVCVFDVAGRLVRTLLDEELPRGRHRAAWDGRSDSGEVVANGVYFYRIDGPDGLVTARFVVMRR